VGKIGVPDAILLKPGRLTIGEMDLMRCHTTIGADLLAHSTSEVIEEARVIALTHHERWDGRGYPAGLRGNAIPIQGRVVAMADALDALTHVRPSKPAYPFDESMRRLITDSGSAFDADVVAALQAAAFRIRDILEPDEVGVGAEAN
jgi:putative two-component system response regulator